MKYFVLSWRFLARVVYSNTIALSVFVKTETSRIFANSADSAEVTHSDLG